METFWFFWLLFRRAYDSAYDSHFWFSLSHKRLTTSTVTATPSLVKISLKSSAFVAGIWSGRKRGRRGALHVLTWCNSLSSHFVPSQIVPQYSQNFSRVLKEVTYVYTSFFKLTSQKKGRFTSSSTLKLWNNLTVKWNDLTMERGVNPWFKHPFPFKSLSRRLKSFLKSRFLKVSRKAVVVYTQDRGNWNSFADSMTKLSDNKTK